MKSGNICFPDGVCQGVIHKLHQNIKNFNVDKQAFNGCVWATYPHYPQFAQNNGHNWLGPKQ